MPRPDAANSVEMFNLNKTGAKVFTVANFNAMRQALAEYLTKVPAFRHGGIGMHNSPARIRQSAHMEAEDVAKALLDRIPLAEPLKPPGDMTENDMRALTEDAKTMLSRLLTTGDPFSGDDWSLVQILRQFIAVCDRGQVATATDWKSAPAIEGKYGEISTTGKQLHPGEPVFLIRATDANACVTLNDYYGHCAQMGCTQEHLDAIIDHMQRIGRWQTCYPQLVKRPD